MNTRTLLAAVAVIGVALAFVPAAHAGGVSFSFGYGNYGGNYGNFSYYNRDYNRNYDRHGHHDHYDRGSRSYYGNSRLYQNYGRYNSYDYSRRNYYGRNNNGCQFRSRVDHHGGHHGRNW